MTIAVLTFVIAFFVFQIPAQKALMNAIAVLVISCPCAWDWPLLPQLW
ncbi:MAG: hypothetical protein R2784_07775 [Saprospiraceae bacterium]